MAEPVPVPPCPDGATELAAGTTTGELVHWRVGGDGDLHVRLGVTRGSRWVRICGPYGPAERLDVDRVGAAVHALAVAHMWLTDEPAGPDHAQPELWETV